MAFSAVTTRSYDNARSGTTYTETTLTAEAVRTRGIVRLYSIPLVGDARGAEAQPLIAPGVFTVDGFQHDLLIVATMGNMLMAFDANAATPTMIWAQRLGNPVTGSRTIDEFEINTNWGILSTPVIDMNKRIIYSVVFTSPDGSYQKGTFWLHANALEDGLDVVKPISLESAKDAFGNRFSGVQRKQRASLLLTKTGSSQTLFIGAGSIFESLESNLGWLIAVDTSTLTIVASLTTCPKQGGGGIWMAGQGPAADTAGRVYFVSGNGNFDAVTDFAECVCRATFDPAGKTLKMSDWFSPFSDSMRDGKSPPAGVPTNMNGWDDQDLGSAGALVVEALGLVVNSGKDGIAYVTRMANLGKTTPAQQRAGTHYKALAHDAEWFTYYPGPTFDASPTDPANLNFNFGGVTHHMHSTPVHYQVGDTHWIYCWGENGNLRAWNLLPSGELVYMGAGAEVASAQQAGMPGGMITVSANKSDPSSGIVWATIPYLDANRVISPGRLIAYAAGAVQHNGVIEKLWDSQDWGIGFSFGKFSVSTVSGGRLYVPTYNATIDVYGLTPA